MKSSFLKEHKATAVNKATEQARADDTAETEILGERSNFFANRALDFPEAYGRCMEVFIATDRNYKTLMARLMAAIYLADPAYTGPEREQRELDIRQAGDAVKALTYQYIDEAEAIRKGLTSQRGEGRYEAVRQYADKLKECPPSAGALAVLAFSPTEENIQAALSNLGKKGAAAMLADAPAQHAKQDVYKCWLDWQEARTTYKGQAAFARAMLAKWDGTLKSQPSIEAWCRQWKRSENLPLIEPAQ